MKKKLLLADDSATIQKVIQLLFAEEPVEVRVAHHGEEALDLVYGWRPDILLADVLLPGMDGYELCRRAKQQEIPVVLLVGTFEPFDFARAEESGYDAYVTKPFDAAGLIEITRELTCKSESPARVSRNAPVVAQRILEFDEAPCPASPGVLPIDKLELNPWSYEIIPQSEPELPVMPVFRPAVVAAQDTARDVKAEITSVLERLLPRWMETLRAELSAELERIS